MVTVSRSLRLEKDFLEIATGSRDINPEPDRVFMDGEKSPFEG